MRLSRETYDERMLQIIGATLRFDRTGGSIERLPVALFVKQYGFTNNFSKTAELTIALKDMVNWVKQTRFATGKSPLPQQMLNFIKSRI